MKLYLSILLILWCSGMLAQRKLVVASLGTKVPQRDIKVRVDNGDEVVVYGQDRRKSMMAGIMMPVTPKEVPLPQVVPAGPNVLAMLAWLFEKTVAPTLEAKQRRKKALKAVRQKEQEYEAKWDALKTPTTPDK